MAPRSLTGNAADPKQIAHAERRLARRAKQRFELVRKTLSTYEGRAFVWSELERHDIYDLVTGPAETVYHFLGKREAGIELFLELKDEHPALYLEMWREALARIDRDNRETEAVQTPSATEDAMTS